MVDVTKVLPARLEHLFEQRRDGALAAGMSAYMRSLFPFYGIPGPAQKEIARTATDGLPAPTQSQLRQIALACWAHPEREWQYFACGYLRKHVGAASSGFLTTARQLITTKSWWDTVDSLAIRTVGPLVSNHPRLVTAMDRWIDSRDMWLARTAILHQIAYKTDTDADRLFACCLRRASDGDLRVRKAIGWALREYSKTDERAVRDFVRVSDRELSPLSRTEAMKWLVRREQQAGPRAGARSRKRPAAG